MSNSRGNLESAVLLPKSAGNERRALPNDRADGHEQQELLEIVRQQPHVDISRSISLHRVVQNGRYQIDAFRLAGKLLDFELRLQRDQGSAGRNPSSSGKSAGPSTSQQGSSN